MNPRIRRGLVVGKFAPLHAGHELVIRRALELCEEVLAISYSKPEFPGCEPANREKWLAEMFPGVRRLVVTEEFLRSQIPDAPEIPTNDAPELQHRHFVGFLCHSILQLHVDAVFTSEDYGDGFASYLTGYFQEHGMGAGPVRHIQVDRNRLQAPISGTVLREDIHANRNWLSPAVYATFVKRICLLGGESSGKSTLAEALARSFETTFAAEYGRELWEAQGGKLAFEDLLRIAETQVRLEEEAARRATRFVFCDTSPLTTLWYCLNLFDKAEEKLYRLAERHYDLVVLCAPDFPFVQDGTRQTGSYRESQHQWYVEQLHSRSIPFLLATGSIDQRVDQVRSALWTTSHVR